MSLTVGSLFAGVGGLDLGLERAGMQVRWQVEIEDFPTRVLERHWPSVTRDRDVRQVGKHNLEPVDLICGGFPCQDLSVAGKRAGLAGERSRLFFEFMRVVAEFAPRWVLIENVPGLLSSNGGRDMGTVLGTLGELGYGYAWRVLDAQYFGVAQRRRRVFIVGCGGNGRRAAQVLFEPESGERDSPPRRKAGRVAPTLPASGSGTSRPGGQKAEPGFYVSHTLTAEGPYSQQRQKWMEQSAAMFGAVRRLTPTECERLQGFPDGWTAVDGEKMPDSPRYRSLGNAICVPVAAWIGRRIVEFDERRPSA